MKKNSIIALSGLFLFLTFLGVQSYKNVDEISIANAEIENNNELIENDNYNIQPKSEVYSINLDIIEAKANHLIFETVEELYSDSDLVVVGEVLKNKVNYAGQISNESLKVSNPFDGFTLTNIKVSKILKADAERLVEVDNKNVNVLEPLFIRDNTVFTFEDYTELVEGANYILFLKYSEEHKAYWVNTLYQGKYNIDNKDKKEKSLEFNNQHFKELKDQVINKYY